MTTAASATGPIPRENDASGGEYLLLVSMLGAFSLWDFYVGEVRVFDFIGLALAIGIAALLALRRPGLSLHIHGPAQRAGITVFVIILFYSLLGIASHPDNFKPAVAMLLGASVLNLVQVLPLKARVIDGSLRYVAYVHLAAFFFQLAYFYGGQEVLNYHAAFSLQPRLLSSVFRPAGLFLEPAIYCFFACSIFLLRRQRTQDFVALDYLLLLSMALSFSLWGVLIAYFLLLIFKTRGALLLTLLVSIAVVAVVDIDEYSRLPIYRLFESRLSNLAGDASAQGRFGGTLALISEVLANPRVIFGQGINNSFEEHGANGLAFMLNSVGLAGTALLVFVLILASPPRQWWLFILGLAIVLTAAPLWKTFYFWLWIALMLLPVHYGVSRQHPAVLPRGR